MVPRLTGKDTMISLISPSLLNKTNYKSIAFLFLSRAKHKNSERNGACSYLDEQFKIAVFL